MKKLQLTFIKTPGCLINFEIYWNYVKCFENDSVYSVLLLAGHVPH